MTSRKSLVCGRPSAWPSSWRQVRYTIPSRSSASARVRRAISLPSASVSGRTNTTAPRADALLRDGIVYLTCLHELGHALGLPHTNDFRDVMYYFGFGGDIVEYFSRYRADLHTRDDIRKVSGLSKNDSGRIRALYGR